MWILFKVKMYASTHMCACVLFVCRRVLRLACMLIYCTFECIDNELNIVWRLAIKRNMFFFCSCCCCPPLSISVSFVHLLCWKISSIHCYSIDDTRHILRWKSRTRYTRVHSSRHRQSAHRWWLGTCIAIELKWIYCRHALRLVLQEPDGKNWILYRQTSNKCIYISYHIIYEYICTNTYFIHYQQLLLLRLVLW